jgi:hypothetical protein
MRLSLKESLTKLLNATNLHRKSGIRGPKKMGEALRQPFVPEPNICSLEKKGGDLFLLTIRTPVGGASTYPLAAHEYGRSASAA